MSQKITYAIIAIALLVPSLLVWRGYEKQVRLFGGVKRSVPLDEIVNGGPPPDGIPPIDHPQFVAIDEAEKFLSEAEIGLALNYKGRSRFYPFQILVWHEIVNDLFDDIRVLVTYCPLCRSGIVFDPVVAGERVEFGTSGKLWNSNLVMYDRKTHSLWSQVLGEAIVGDMTGTKLKVLASDIIRFGAWKRAFPQGEVLSRNTGQIRDYGTDPYGNYYTTSGTYFPINHTDNRLDDKELVLGLVVNGHAKAYYPVAIQRAGKIEDSLAGKIIVGEYDTDIEAVRLFEKKPDGTLERLNPVAVYWFSWAAAHPDTELFK
ncbi:MAG: DUF3179 domain-containing protein [Candidatus Magasanikbacteria bacterium]|nr:DUF3179 domain-containing protein [Candidatus Magasanikbacteria bacterium]